MNKIRGGIATLVLVCSGAHASVEPTALWYAWARDGGGAKVSQLAEVHCLALNVYHEARGETLEGMLAVAAVTLNRMRHKHFPNRLCEVVWQPRQFSWTHDGKSDRPRDRKAWQRALRIAKATLAMGYFGTVGDAVYFHAEYGRAPYWSRRFEKIRKIGRHIFYRG